MVKRSKLFKKYFKKNSGKVNQEVIDLINQDFSNAVFKAKQVLLIDDSEVGGPITISVPDSVDGRNVKFKNVLFEDETNQIVYDQTLLTVLFFDKKHLNYYQSNIDHVSGEIKYDVSGSILFKNIIHVQHLFSYDNPSNPKVERLDVELNLIDGTIIPLRIRNRFITPKQKDAQQVLSDKEIKVLEAIKMAI